MSAFPKFGRNLGFWNRHAHYINIVCVPIPKNSVQNFIRGKAKMNFKVLFPKSRLERSEKSEKSERSEQRLNCSSCSVNQERLERKRTLSSVLTALRRGPSWRSVHQERLERLTSVQSIQAVLWK